MSAPDTNLKKQRRRHRGPIVGIAFGFVFVAILVVVLALWPGVPLDEQAAPDTVTGGTAGGDAAAADPSGSDGAEGNPPAEESQ